MKLSDDAMLCAGCLFGLMNPDGKSERLRFNMIENQPTDRVANGLSELVREGYLKRVDEANRAHYYILMKDCSPFLKKVRSLTKKVGPLTITEPLVKEEGVKS